MHDIVEFLQKHEPFSDLSEDALEELARATEVEYFPAGATIFRQEEGPIQHVRIIRRGAVELLDRGRVLDLLGEGELFGHPSMLSGLPTGFEARAVEDTLTYRLPADAVVPLLGRPAGLQYVARSLLARPRPKGQCRSATSMQPNSRWQGWCRTNRSSSDRATACATQQREWRKPGLAPRSFACRMASWESSPTAIYAIGSWLEI
jgi:signal-transduction protein with cAMP-binding, CBS, and nucleotidyltransferase domain